MPWLPQADAAPMRRLQRPLDPQAVAAANDAVRAQTGGRPLTTEPEDAALRKQWVDAYLAAGGKERKVTSRRVASAVQPCRPPIWTELQYSYVSGRGVPGAGYTITDADGHPIASGVLDDKGFAHVGRLSPDLSDINYCFQDDPPYTIFASFQPMPNPYPVPPPDYIEQAGNSGRLAEVLDWIWGTVQGDFNDDPSFGQIATGTVITLIPVVDQVGDVRDVTANLKKIVYDARYDEFGNWLGLVFAIIGCIPAAGTVIKGVLKAVGKKAVDVFALIRKLNFAGEGHAVQWLRKLLDDLPSHQAFVLDKIERLLADFVEKLGTARRFVSAASEAAFDRLQKACREALLRARDMVGRAFEGFKEQLQRRLGTSAKIENSGATLVTNKVAQTSEPLSDVAHGVEKETKRELKKLALGLKDPKKGLDYKAWGKERGMGTYADFGGRGSFSEQIEKAMKDVDEIHFNLDEVNVQKASGRLNDYGEPAAGYTNYELHLLKKPEFADKVTWWKDGVAMPKGWSPF